MIKFASSVLLLASAVAGAQTVTVGSTTSTQNGTTTTITVPVSVAVPPATTGTAAAAMASLRVDTGASGTPVNQSFGGSFKTVALPNVVADTASGWNSSSNTYTVPTTGTYLILTSVRFFDNLPANISYGQGANTSNIDTPYFFWTTTAGLRNGSTNMRVMQLSAGQTVDLYIYADTNLPLSSASMSIQQLQ